MRIIIEISWSCCENEEDKLGNTLIFVRHKYFYFFTRRCTTTNAVRVKEREESLGMRNVKHHFTLVLFCLLLKIVSWTANSWVLSLRPTEAGNGVL